MRVGYNPHKDVPIQGTAFTHQVIIPVYIPNFDGYFNDALKILTLSLESLLKTIHDKTFVTVVNNGSSNEVASFLNGMFFENKIHELIHTENIGKPNAILKGLAGNNIELVTVSDADTLFLPGWQQETARIFSRIPKAGIVGLVPQITTFRSYSGNTIFDNLFSPKLRFLKVKNPHGFKRFYDSLGWSAEAYNANHGKYMLALDWADDLKAILGSGHFVLTYKKDIFEEAKTYLAAKLGGDALGEGYIDGIGLRKDYWRLTTYDNFAYHMGNVFEPWMQDELDAMVPINSQPPSGFATREPIGKIPYFIKNRVFVKFIKVGWLYRWFLKWKKLPDDIRGNY